MSKYKWFYLMSEYNNNNIIQYNNNNEKLVPM